MFAHSGFHPGLPVFVYFADIFWLWWHLEFGLPCSASPAAHRSAGSIGYRRLQQRFVLRLHHARSIAPSSRRTPMRQFVLLMWVRCFNEGRGDFALLLHHPKSIAPWSRSTPANKRMSLFMLPLPGCQLGGPCHYGINDVIETTSLR